MTFSPRTLFLVVSLALTGVASAAAQTGDSQQPTPAPVVRQHHEHSPQQQTRKLTRKLGLSQDQAAQVEPILAARREQMQALKSNPPSDPRLMHQQMRSISHDTRQKIDAILTAPQREQLAAMHHHHKREMQPVQAAPTV